MTNHLDTLKYWLKSNCCVCVPDDWLEACVEWIQEENQGSSLQLDTLKNQVYEQWLMSDLRELKTPSLPTEITTNRKVEINGTFAVQIDSAVDVGCSFYSQRQKLKGTENPNALVSGDEPKQPAWEQKPTRMIILDLTDGVTDVKAMEYKPITDLTPFITPGTKMLIRGPVLCRQGMLMLGPENVQILRGEVDNLMETNTPETLLAAAMQEGQINDGKSDRQEFSGRMLTRGEDKKVLSGVGQPAVKQEFIKREPVTRVPIIKQEFIKREPVSQQYQHTARGNAQPTGRQRPQPNIKQKTADPDWEDDFDYDALMADMEEDTAPPKGDNSNRQIKTEPRRPDHVSHTQSRSTSQQGQMKINDEDFMDDFDDDFEFQTSFCKPIGNQIKQEPQSQPSQVCHSASSNTSNINSGIGIASHNYRNASRNSNTANSSTLAGPRFQEHSVDTKSGCSVSSKIGNVLTSPLSVPVKRDEQKHQLSNSARHFGAKDSSYVELADFDEDFDMEDLELGQVQELERCSEQSKKPKTETLGNNLSRTSVNIDINYSSSQTGTDLYTAIKVDVPKAVIHPFSDSNNSNNQGKTSCVQSQTNRNNGSGQRERGQSRMDRFLGGSSSDCVASPLTSGPTAPRGEDFTYLSAVLSRLPVRVPEEIIVKGYISTLTSKLTSNQGKHWSLSCKINDGSGALNVDLSNSVLTKLIGFSAEDSAVMKHRAKFDQTVKDVLVEGLQQCQQSLTDLSSLMKIQFLPGQSKPIITQIIPVTSSHVLSLYDRITKQHTPDR